MGLNQGEESTISSILHNKEFPRSYQYYDYLPFLVNESIDSRWKTSIANIHKSNKFVKRESHHNDALNQFFLDKFKIRVKEIVAGKNPDKDKIRKIYDLNLQI